MARTVRLPHGFEAIDFKCYAKKAATAQGRLRCWALGLIQKGKTVEQAALAIGKTRQSVHTWLKWLEQHGVQRLVGKVKGRGRKALVEATKQELVQVCQELQQARRWRCTAQDFAREIEKRWGKRYGRSGIYVLLHRMGLSWVSARSVHPQADLEQQEAFKKTSGKAYRKNSPKTLSLKQSRSGSKTNTASVNKAR